MSFSAVSLRFSWLSRFFSRSCLSSRAATASSISVCLQDHTKSRLRTGAPAGAPAQASPVPLGPVQLVPQLQQLLVRGELRPLRLVQVFAEVLDLRGQGRVPSQQLLLVEQDLLVEVRLNPRQFLLGLRPPRWSSTALLRLNPEPESGPAHKPVFGPEEQRGRGSDLQTLHLGLQLFGVQLAVLPQLPLLGRLRLGVVQLSFQLMDTKGRYSGGPDPRPRSDQDVLTSLRIFSVLRISCFIVSIFCRRASTSSSLSLS